MCFYSTTSIVSPLRKEELLKHKSNKHTLIYVRPHPASHHTYTYHAVRSAKRACGNIKPEVIYGNTSRQFNNLRTNKYNYRNYKFYSFSFTLQ